MENNIMDTPDLTHLSARDYENIYEPAEDSFLLIDALEKDLTFLRTLKPSLCVEIGSGSGIIITALAKALGSNSSYLAIDVNPRACAVTKKTAAANGMDVEVVTMDLVSGLRASNAVDVLVFNPPYVVTPSEEVAGKGTDGVLARAWAGGLKGREVMDRLFPRVPGLISHQGVFYLVVINENCPEEILETFEGMGFHTSILLQRKIRSEHLLVLKFIKTI